MTTPHKQSPDARRAAKKYRKKHTHWLKSHRKHHLTPRQKAAVKAKVANGFFKKIAKLREALSLPATIDVPLKEHSAGFIDAVLAEATKVDDEAKKNAKWDPKAFATYVLNQSPDYTGTDTGLAALQFENWCAEEAKELFAKLVETEVRADDDTFLAIFEGKLTEDDWSRIKEDCQSFVTFEVLVEAGNLNVELGEVVDVTILEGTVVPGAELKKPNALQPDGNADEKPADQHRNRNESVTEAELVAKGANLDDAEVTNRGVVLVLKNENGEDETWTLKGDRWYNDGELSESTTDGTYVGKSGTWALRKGDDPEVTEVTVLNRATKDSATFWIEEPIGALVQATDAIASGLKEDGNCDEDEIDDAIAAFLISYKSAGTGPEESTDDTVLGSIVESSGDWGRYDVRIGGEALVEEAVKRRDKVLSARAKKRLAERAKVSAQDTVVRFSHGDWRIKLLGERLIAYMPNGVGLNLHREGTKRYAGWSTDGLRVAVAEAVQKAAVDIVSKVGEDVAPPMDLDKVKAHAETKSLRQPGEWYVVKFPNGDYGILRTDEFRAKVAVAKKGSTKAPACVTSYLNGKELPESAIAAEFPRVEEGAASATHVMTVHLGSHEGKPRAHGQYATPLKNTIEGAGAKVHKAQGHRDADGSHLTYHVSGAVDAARKAVNKSYAVGSVEVKKHVHESVDENKFHATHVLTVHTGHRHRRMFVDATKKAIKGAGAEIHHTGGSDDHDGHHLTYHISGSVDAAHTAVRKIKNVDGADLAKKGANESLDESGAEVSVLKRAEADPAVKKLQAHLKKHHDEPAHFEHETRTSAPAPGKAAHGGASMKHVANVSGHSHKVLRDAALAVGYKSTHHVGGRERLDHSEGHGHLSFGASGVLYKNHKANESLDEANAAAGTSTAADTYFLATKASPKKPWVLDRAALSLDAAKVAMQTLGDKEEDLLVVAVKADSAEAAAVAVASKDFVDLFDESVYEDNAVTKAFTRATAPTVRIARKVDPRTAPTVRIHKKGEEPTVRIVRRESIELAVPGFMVDVPATKPAKHEVVEVAPPGWSGTVKAMKSHKDIKNPFALAWAMKKRGAKPHVAPEKKAKAEAVIAAASTVGERLSYATAQAVAETVTFETTMSGSVGGFVSAGSTTAAPQRPAGTGALIGSTEGKNKQMVAKALAGVSKPNRQFTAKDMEEADRAISAVVEATGDHGKLKRLHRFAADHATSPQTSSRGANHYFKLAAKIREHAKAKGLTIEAAEVFELPLMERDGESEKPEKKEAEDYGVTKNEGHGYHGTARVAGKTAEQAHALFRKVHNHLVKHHDVSPVVARNYLDSSYGRHLSGHHESTGHSTDHRHIEAALTANHGSTHRFKKAIHAIKKHTEQGYFEGEEDDIGSKLVEAFDVLSEAKLTGSQKDMTPGLDFQSEDVQTYYDMMIFQSMEEDEAREATMEKFGLSDLTVSPVGIVSSKDFPMEGVEKKQKQASDAAAAATLQAGEQDPNLLDPNAVPDQGDEEGDDGESGGSSKGASGGGNHFHFNFGSGSKAGAPSNKRQGAGRLQKESVEESYKLGYEGAGGTKYLHRAPNGSTDFMRNRDKPKTHKLVTFRSKEDAQKEAKRRSTNATAPNVYPHHESEETEFEVIDVTEVTKRQQDRQRRKIGSNQASGATGTYHADYVEAKGDRPDAKDVEAVRDHVRSGLSHAEAVKRHAAHLEGLAKSSTADNVKAHFTKRAAAIRTHKPAVVPEAVAKDQEHLSKADYAKLKAVYDSSDPEVAEDGKAYVVQWADGRAVFAVGSKKKLQSWAENYDGVTADIVSIKYGPAEFNGKKLRVIESVDSIVAPAPTIDRKDFMRYFVPGKSVVIEHVWWTIKSRDLKKNEATLVTSEYALKDGHKAETKVVRYSDILKNIEEGKWGGSVPQKGHFGLKQDRKVRNEHRVAHGLRALRECYEAIDESCADTAGRVFSEEELQDFYTKFKNPSYVIAYADWRAKHFQEVKGVA